MRRFIRHSTDIPINVIIEGPSPEQKPLLNNISVAGLSFHAAIEYKQNSFVKIAIPTVCDDFETPGRVVWCRASDTGFDIGVELLNREDMYMARMVEQICHIEHYKKAVLKQEGREMSGELAAIEWVEKYAAEFPTS